MRYFLDTEFIESGSGEPIYLLSIGIVAENGREFYAIVSDAPREKANDWVKTNVLPGLRPSGLLYHWLLLSDLKDAIKFFIGDDPKPEFWGYYADYDWVVFCQTFGTMLDLPKGWPKFCRDLKQWCADLGNPELPNQDSTEHNALYDARWNKQVWEFLQCSLKSDSK